MPILLKCEGCGKALKARDALAGRTAKCPSCGGAGVVRADKTGGRAAGGGERGAEYPATSAEGASANRSGSQHAWECCEKCGRQFVDKDEAGDTLWTEFSLCLSCGMWLCRLCAKRHRQARSCARRPSLLKGT